MYIKLFAAILDSSIWLESPATCKVWITLLVSADRDGFSRFASAQNLARRSVVSDSECQEAVTVLQAPDVNSSNPDNEGRRVERVPGGWMILNYQYYHDLATRLMQLESNRKRVKKHREKRKSSHVGNGDETPCNEVKQNVMQSEVEVEAESTPPNPLLPVTPQHSEVTAAMTNPSVSTERSKTLGDLQAVYNSLVIFRTDHDRGSALLSLYGWDACCDGLTALCPLAKKRDPGKQRVLVGELGEWLEKHYELDADDYRRTGLPFPGKT